MVTLRQYQISDAERLAAIANNPNVARYLSASFPHPYTLEDARWWIKTGSTAGGGISKAIEYQGKLVGGVGIAPLTGWQSHVAEIGYWLGEAYWGQGIATKAVKQISEFAFQELGYQKLYGRVYTYNEASMAVLKKCGYQLEAILKSEICRDGQYLDVHRFSRWISE
ncbi:MAG: GNAT family protein [Cyanobacteria bacterium P01_H01_bin.119]